MHNNGRGHKIWSRQSPPSLERRGFPEGHMGLDAIPLDEQPVLSGVFDDPFQRHAVARWIGFEGRCGLGNRGFKST